MLGTLASSSVRKTTLCLDSGDAGWDSEDSEGFGDISELILSANIGHDINDICRQERIYCSSDIHKDDPKLCKLSSISLKLIFVGQLKDSAKQLMNK